MINKLFHKIKIKSAQNQVIIVCVCFMLLSMVAIGFYTSSILYQKLFGQKSNEMQMYAKKTVENLEQVFSFAANTGLAVATSESVMDWVDNPSIFSEEDKDYYKRLYELKSEINHILTYSNAWNNNYIGYISVLVNGEVLTFSASKPLPEKAVFESSYQIYEALKKKKEVYVGNMKSITEDDKIFHIRTMKHVYNREESLTILIAIEEKTLRGQYSSDLLNVEMESYLIDDEGVVFSASREELRGEKCKPQLWDALKQGSSAVTIDGTAYMCEAKELEGTTLTFLSLVPRSEIVHQAFSGMPGYLAISAVLCLALLGIGILISYRSTSFIKDMAEGMEQIKRKNYEVKMPHYGNEAVDYLSDSFNSMTDAMKILVTDTYEAKIMLQEIQLEFLQQQMNPHFLFNILLTIQVRAKLCADETVYNMLESLSGFLRAGIYSDKNNYTILGEELKSIRFYLYLQQQRFEGKLEYCINVPEELLNWEIPRLSIQPMVENAIVHGVEHVEETVHVGVDVKMNGEDLEIIIWDDGAGFCIDDVDLSEEVSHRKGDSEIGKISRDKIGLKNTNKRMKILYGEQYYLQIKSELGQGTKIIMHVPPERTKGR